MRGIIARQGAELSPEKTIALLKAADHGVLATVDLQGRPSTVALNHVLIDDHTLIFHGKKTGEKVENIRHNPHVSFFVTGHAKVVPSQFETAYTSVVAHGRAEILEDEEEIAKHLAAIVARFVGDAVSPTKKEEYIKSGLPVVAIIKLSIEHLTGKARYTKGQ